MGKEEPFEKGARLGSPKKLKAMQKNAKDEQAARQKAEAKEALEPLVERLRLAVTKHKIPLYIEYDYSWDVKTPPHSILIFSAPERSRSWINRIFYHREPRSGLEFVIRYADQKIFVHRIGEFSYGRDNDESYYESSWNKWAGYLIYRYDAFPENKNYVCASDADRIMEWFGNWCAKRYYV